MQAIQGYHKNARELAIMQRDRNIDLVAKAHGLDSNELLNWLESSNMILDLGSGVGELVRIISSLGKYKIIGLDRHPEQEAHNTIQGDFGELPFGSNTFDRLISTCALGRYGTDVNELRLHFSEAIRIMEVGGKVRIALVTYFDDTYGELTKFSNHNDIIRYGEANTIYSYDDLGRQANGTYVLNEVLDTKQLRELSKKVVVVKDRDFFITAYEFERVE